MAIKYDKILNDIREADTTTKGDTGVDGDTGVAGPKGDTGTQGDTGAGLQGDTGADSTVQGDTGVKGDTGVQGDSGYVGSDGDTGVKGDTGSTGAKGDTGTAGSQGDTGATGSQGDQGDTGSTGSAGAKGDTGTTGNQGDTGSAGAKGDTGTTGSAGSQGDTGVQGDTGAGVQGDTGTAGSQGDTGVTGDTGTQYPWDGAWVTSTAYAVNDCVEYQGSGYVCVTAHTSGTFATDLSAGKWELLVEKGDQGDTGTAGSAGDQGDTGVAGAKGDTGTAGTQGDTGVTGAVGDTGVQGDSGYVGSDGDTGIQGDTGVQGDTGIAPTDTHVMGEVPTGTVNGTNTDFDVSNTPASGSLRVYVNGVRQKVTDDYSLSGTTITFVTAPETGDKILCDYFTTAGEIAQGSTSFVYDETPGGTVNSSNTSFTIANTPVSGTLQLYRDGQLLKGGSADYSLSGTTITMTTAPTTGSVLSAFYQQSLTVAGNADTLDSYHADTFLEALQTGWFAAGETWTYSSSDDPTYVVTVPSDATTKYSPGMRVKLTDSGTQYFIITAVTATTITLYGGTDYNLTTGTITSPYFSSWKAPFGFPLSPTKWEATASAAGYTKSSPSASTWYATGDSLVVPIGAWNLSYGAGLQGFKSAAQIKVALTLSSDGSTETDSDLTSWVRLDSGGVVSVPCSRQKSILQTSKTTWEFLVYTPISSMTQINLIGDDGVYNLRAVCAYL